MATPTRLRVVLDTDTFNEVDDQFALAHLLLSPRQVKLEAVYAAPFFIPKRCKNPADGMEKSYEEIQRVLKLVPTKNPPPVLRGSRRYLPDAKTPVESEAARDLVQRALATRPGKLHVLGIAVATNLASALLMEPRIAKKIVVVWLGGHAPHWPTAAEFNLGQDIHAARILLNSGVPLVQVPCYPVASHLLVTVAELEQHLGPHSRLGRYLTDIVKTYGHAHRHAAWSKPIWDIAVSAWAVNRQWVATDRRPSPILRDNLRWGFSARRHPVAIARQVDRDAIFHDFFTKARRQEKPARAR
jgi:inosine-uridine nucleoside N-ribohydrolase